MGNLFSSLLFFCSNFCFGFERGERRAVELSHACVAGRALSPPRQAGSQAESLTQLLR
jgi:hypothetical protein